MENLSQETLEALKAITLLHPTGQQNYSEKIREALIGAGLVKETFGGLRATEKGLEVIFQIDAWSP